MSEFRDELGARLYFGQASNGVEVTRSRGAHCSDKVVLRGEKLGFARVEVDRGEQI